MKLLRMMNTNTKFAQFMRFVLVGGVATIIHYSIYLILTQIGLILNIAYTLGYAISFIFNYIASNYFTFKAKPNTKNGIKFIGAHCCNYLIQMLLLNIYISMGIPEKIAPIGVFAIAIPINFILVRLALKD